MRRRRRHRHERDGGLEPSLEAALSSLERTGRPVIVRRKRAVAAVLISLEDFTEHLAASTPELSVVKPSEPAPQPRHEPEPLSPTGTLEALRELRELGSEHY